MPDSVSARRPESGLGGGPVGEQAGGLDLGGHVGELELDSLEFADRMPECGPLARVAERLFVGGLGDADGAGRNVDPAGLQSRPGVPPSRFCTGTRTLSSTTSQDSTPL
jgi:hypothetical protein